MAKQFIISAMEETLGEYILNISKDNLKIATLRGELKLENVQLDGDLVGSHVLGAVGLSSYGVLSCSAKSIKVSIPWKNLEKEPTLFEIQGVHLICVPLTPSTANQMYGAGTLLDPRCTLRTRAKRLVLARYERNYWNGLIPGEGPVMKRIQRAVKDVERDRKRSSSKTRKREKHSSSTMTNTEENEMEELINNVVQNLGGGGDTSNQSVDLSTDLDDTSFFSTTTATTGDELPQLPRDWKVKLREKILRNIEASFHDLHIRLEVPEHGLDFTGVDATTSTQTSPSRYPKLAERRAFTLGFTLESLVIRTANSKWEAGSHEKRNFVDETLSSMAKDHLGPNEYVTFNNKIGYFNKLSIYWDDDPQILLSETDALQGNYRKYTPDKLQAKVVAAMDALFSNQDPGNAIRQSLSARPQDDRVGGTAKPHFYVCEYLDAEVRVRTSDRVLPGPISCSADVLPFNFAFNVRPSHYLQYQKLKAAVQSQQRFDTMPRQRPFDSPLENPRAWWRYAILCVTSRPNARPWQDVKRIGLCRTRYIELVMKKNADRGSGVGYHAGLSSKQSDELLLLEDSLPIEALLAFHLVALRRVHTVQTRQNNTRGSFHPDARPGTSRFRMLRPTSGTNKNKPPSPSSAMKCDAAEASISTHPIQPQGVADSGTAISQISLLEAMTLRLGKKVWFVDWKLRDATVSFLLRRRPADTPMIQFVLRASGNLRSYGQGKRDFGFAVSQCDIMHKLDKVLFFGSVSSSVFIEEDLLINYSDDNVIDSNDSFDLLANQCNVASGILQGPDLLTPSKYLELPEEGTACRIIAGKDRDTFKLSISAHPATLVWTTSLSDSVAEFFSEKSSDLHKDMTRHIRNFATPMARKAQLALLSPASLSLHLNIAAPKVWIPLISGDAEGSLVLDAGTLRFVSTKDEGETEVQWKIQARDIGAKFVRGLSLTRFASQPFPNFRTFASIPVGQGQSVVVRPFTIAATSSIIRGTELGDTFLLADSIRNIEIIVSPICLNLVDAEIIARLLGKLYARGLHRVRHDSPHGDIFPTDDDAHGSNVQLSFQDIKWSDLPRVVTVQIEKVEIALEGHSKQLLNSDERSIASLDTALQEFAPSTRAYLVEIFNISAKKSSLRHTEVTRVSIVDASIVRLRDVSQYSPLAGRRECIESENCILERSADRSTSIRLSTELEDKSMSFHPTSNENFQRDIFRASILHNRLAHLDEVEVDIDAVILRITPTTLKDCSKAFRRIMELGHLVTKEMERKVHEQGRNARRRNFARDGEGSQIGSLAASHIERPGSPAFSEAMTDFTTIEMNPSPNGMDSSIHFRVTLNNCAVLVGRPMSTTAISPSYNQNPPFAVMQILSNALVMFQSIENPDSTGTKTLHVSVDNVSGLVNTKFEYVRPDEAPLVLEPTGGEFRVVYYTESFGCIVSQDVSVNLDSLKSCLTPNDASVIINISRTMIERLRSFGIQQGVEDIGRRGKVGALASLVRYKKKGTGVATRIRMEVQSLSFIVLRSYKSFFGAPEFLDFSVKHMKGLFEGCVSAFSGDLSCNFSVASYNSNVSDWDNAVEPCEVNIGMEQMPNELVINVAPISHLHLNVTGTLLRDLTEMIFDFGRHRPSVDPIGVATLEPSVLSTVGLRRASESRSVTVVNQTGLDIQIVPNNMIFSSESQVFCNNSTSILDTARGVVNDDFFLCLRLAPSSVSVVGERQSVHSLSVGTSSNDSRLFLLRPKAPSNILQPGQAEVLRLLNGRSSPESILSEGPVLDTAYYNAEPVVECCMENQRLRPSVVDTFSLKKGHDLLSSTIWSPEEITGEEIVMDEYEDCNHSSYTMANGPEAAAGTGSSQRVNTEQMSRPTNPGGLTKGNWLRPYLKNDSPEWSDMTCMLSIAREKVLLPDSRWIWLNDWNVDVSARLGLQTDTDGWSYESDFETFSSTKRHYIRGDACRRRKWTRTRMAQPPSIHDPLRQLKFVWETAKDDNGCYVVTVRSHVRVRNSTSSSLSFFVYTPSWDEDKFVGSAKAGEELCVPVDLASAVYMRIAIATTTASSNEPSLSDFAVGPRFLIVPTSYNSSSYIRTRLHLEDVMGTVLHHIVELTCDKGILDIVVLPVFRIVNLLPCQLECQVGHVHSERVTTDLSPRRLSKRLAKTEAFVIPSGQETSCTAVNPWLKPHISLRVPGYKWSSWKKVVNRKLDTSWRPTESEEEWCFESKVDAEYGDEVKTIVRFERLNRIGDPLTLLFSVTCDHCPIIRIFSQYWIINKTGFGCHFSEGFTDILGNKPDPFTSRRSYYLKEEVQNPAMAADMLIPGHEWSVGSCGMSLYFSQREKLTLAIETGIDNSLGVRGPKSKWISPLDISNVIPKTVFSVDEVNGTRRFELAIHVTLCPGKFGRTKMISLLPRYLIVNLLHRELVIAQDGCLDAEMVIPSQSSISFHWEKSGMPPKVRLGAPSAEERARGNYERCWTNGRFQLDRVGITSLRLPTTNTLVKLPMVVQAEVRLATKDQASAVVVVVWSGNDRSNPLYTLRNRTRHVILCRQPLQDENDDLIGPEGVVTQIESCTGPQSGSSVFECGGEIGPIIRSFLGLDRVEEFVWVLKPGTVTCFGFDDPEKPHILEWTYVSDKKSQFTKKLKRAFLEIDAMGSFSLLPLPSGAQMKCQIKAEHSTKVIEFIEIGVNGQIIEPLSGVLAKDALRQHGLIFPELLGSEGRELSGSRDSLQDDEEDEVVAFSLKVVIPDVAISVVDNLDPKSYSREILLAQIENLHFAFSQTIEGYHNFEVRLMTLQVDNHIQSSIHPVMIFCPRVDEREPLFHLSAVRRLQPNSNTFVFRYAAIRLLEIEISMDRRTTETIARFIQPLLILQEDVCDESPHWITTLTTKMAKSFSKSDRRSPIDLENTTLTANSGRIYFEQLHLHPVRLGLTFTQEWLDYRGALDTVMVFQFIRGMASIANAPLVFTSFVVGHVFESPQALFRVISTHYSSQLTKQVFGILGSLAIFGAPADFISNVGTGVKDFLYEPLQGAVIGPREFLEGLEVGTQSLARGVFVGVVRGAANVTDAVNSNLAGLTADENFIDERKTHQRRLTDAMSRGVSSRTFQDSLNIAYASIAHGLKSGALGIIEQPAIYASKHGPIGFLKGIGKAIVGVVVKPVVGLGDGVVVVMNHMSDMTSKKQIHRKVPKRLRRALPSRTANNPSAVYLESFDENAAKAQEIVTGAESVDDVYLGHVNIPSHLVIASERSLWAIDKRSREPWCVSWEEVSHYSLTESGVKVVVFSQTGLKTYVFHVENNVLLLKFHQLLSMQHQKMANASELNDALSNATSESFSIPGVRAPQVNHIFGSCNGNIRKRIGVTINDEVDLVEQCHHRVRKMDSSSNTFFRTLDGEAWALISSWGQLFTGLSSRRCIVASVINGTGYPIQIKSTRLIEGGSPCYSLATREYDTEQGILHAGGVILFFGWGAVPNLLQAGNVCMYIETNGFTSTMAHHKSSSTIAIAMPGYQVGFLEKSYDDSGWWAKYWLLVRGDTR